MVLLTSRSGQIITMDVFANQQTNYNMAIAATSGAGKSFFMNNWIKSYLGIGGQVWSLMPDSATSNWWSCSRANTSSTAPTP